jgi:hypothetical protein
MAKKKSAGASAPVKTAQAAANTAVAPQDEDQLQDSGSTPADTAADHVAEQSAEAPASDIGAEADQNEAAAGNGGSAEEQGDAAAPDSEAESEFPAGYTIKNQSRVELVLPGVNASVARFGGETKVTISSEEQLQALNSELDTLKVLNNLPSDAFTVTATE